MQLTRVVAPAATVVSLEELREQVRLIACGSPPETDDDAFLERIARVAVSELDGADGWLGRALIDQTWLLTLSGFPSGLRRTPWYAPILLPLTSPAWSGGSPAPAPIVSVQHVAPDGTLTTMVEGTDFEVVTDADPQYIRPLYGACWPATRCQLDAVRVTYVAGYGAAASDVPEEIRDYVLLRVGQLYEFRELVVAGTTVAVPPYLRDMLENVRQRLQWWRE